MSRARRGRPRQPLKKRESAKLTAWRRSPRCRRVALAALEIAHAVRAAMPKCGAKRKRDGQPCMQLAMENGRCKFHGGRTPSGNGWHRPRMPAKGEVGGLEKFEKKLKAAEQRRAFRFQRLAMMSPPQRERFLKWEATHQPGPASGRIYRRRQLETKAMLDKLLAESDARRAVEEQRERALREVLRNQKAAEDPPEPKVEDGQQEPHVDVFA